METTEKLDILVGRLAALEAFVLTVAETCMTASIRDLDKLSRAMAAVELSMVHRVDELAQQMGTPLGEQPEGAAHVALIYAGHYISELRARLQKRLLEHVEKLAALEAGPIN
jgi:hypothetical protein